MKDKKPSPANHFYKCERCRSKFALAEAEQGVDPYPVDAEMPEQENLVWCLSCRKTVNTLFSKMLALVFPDAEPEA